jgi:hypothetical protein
MLAPNAANSRESSQNTKLKNKDSKKENIKKNISSIKKNRYNIIIILYYFNILFRSNFVIILI